MKRKIWTSNRADIEFSKWIRKRDERCVFCGRSEPYVQLTNSHYWGRYISSTRYDPINCDTLCVRCHYEVEGAKQGKYREWKMKQLGTKEYEALRKRYYQVKMKREDAILACMRLLGKL